MLSQQSVCFQGGVRPPSPKPQDEDTFRPKWQSSPFGIPFAHREAFEALWQFLVNQGRLDCLPLEKDTGRLLVNVPFCGTLGEGATLVRLLQQTFLSRPTSSIHDISILAIDVEERAGYCWATKEEWIRRIAPRVNLQLRCADLKQKAMPRAALTIAAHPEAMNDGWQSIVANVLRGVAPDGLCIFATFFEDEMKEVVSMCKNVGAKAEVFDNPYYDTHPVPKVTYGNPSALTHLPFLRFIIQAHPPLNALHD